MYPPRWLHYLAVGTVCAALPLLFLGAEVTTKGVGMADQRSVVSPWQAIGEFLQGNQSFGWAIEHSHRLFGWLVGLCGIALAIGAWVGERRLWVKGLATAGLLLIGAQGLLGIYRVQLNAMLGPTLALIHGAFAPIVVATLASVALVTSGSWATHTKSGSVALRNSSLIVVVLVFAQLVLGSVVRHQQSAIAARMHLFSAFIVVVGLVWLATMAWHEGEPFGRLAPVLVVLLVLQLLLGMEALFSWALRRFDPSMAIHETNTEHWVRSGHYVLGALIFASTVLMALRAHRGLAFFLPTLPLFQREAEVAA